MHIDHTEALQDKGVSPSHPLLSVTCIPNESHFWWTPQVPILPTPPTFQEGWKLQDSKPVTRALYNVVKDMVERMNQGIEALQMIKNDGL